MPIGTSNPEYISFATDYFEHRKKMAEEVYDSHIAEFGDIHNPSFFDLNVSFDYERVKETIEEDTNNLVTKALFDHYLRNDFIPVIVRKNGEKAFPNYAFLRA